MVEGKPCVTENYRTHRTTRANFIHITPDRRKVGPRNINKVGMCKVIKGRLAVISVLGGNRHFL